MRKYLKVVLWTAVVLGAIAAVLRYTVLDVWTIPKDDPVATESLVPSVAAGDTVLLYRGTPSFGDLVRCTDPESPGHFLVGRIMGEPGDRVEVRGGELLVNDKHATQEMSCSPATVKVEDPHTGVTDDVTCSIEAIGGRKHKRATHGARDAVTSAKSTVPDGMFFLVSDNRVHPFDSRDYGPVPAGTCKEMIFFRVVGEKGLGDYDTRFSFIQ